MAKEIVGDLSVGSARLGGRVRCVRVDVLHLKKGNVYTIYTNSVEGITLQEIFFGSGNSTNRPMYKHALFNLCV